MISSQQKYVALFSVVESLSFLKTVLALHDFNLWTWGVGLIADMNSFINIITANF